MADRPTAPRGPRPPVNAPVSPATAGVPEAFPHQTTARVAPAAQLPGIFWGALGCVSVLGVGFTVLFLVLRPGSPATAAPPLPPPTAAVVAPPPPAEPRPTPDIQPLAPPPAAATPAEAEPAHPKAPVHPIKVARAAKVEKKAAKPPADQSGGDSDETAAPKKAAAEKSGAEPSADDDQPAPRHRERASDDPEDE